LEQSQQAYSEMGEMGKAALQNGKRKWLTKTYKTNPTLFPQWTLVHP